MSTRKAQITKTEILNVIRENADKFKKDLQAILKENEDDTAAGLESMAGAEEDRVIQYPTNPGIESPEDAEGADKPAEFTGGADGAELDDAAMASKLSKTAPSQLLDYLEKLEEAKSILSKVAAGETDQVVKNKIYQHYEKVQKTAFEMIKEFGIVH